MSVLTNQQYIVNELPLKNSGKQFMVGKNFVTRSSQEPNSVFPLGKMALCSLIQ